MKKHLDNLKNGDAFDPWNLLISFNLARKVFQKAFVPYAHMHRLELCPATFVVSSTLKACVRIVHKTGGVLIHTHAYTRGYVFQIG